jgi:hypothetical protein
MLSIGNTRERLASVGLAIDQPTSVRKFLQRTRSVSHRLGRTRGHGLPRKLGNLRGGLPFSVMLDAEGRVRQRRMGRLSEADLKAWSGLG